MTRTVRTKPRGTQREQDERALMILRLRATGMTTTAIAARFGVSQQVVSSLCNAVARSDMTYHDPRATPDDYRKAYPWT
jgi:transposase